MLSSQLQTTRSLHATDDTLFRLQLWSFFVLVRPEITSNQIRREQIIVTRLAGALTPLQRMRLPHVRLRIPAFTHYRYTAGVPSRCRRSRRLRRANFSFFVQTPERLLRPKPKPLMPGPLYNSASRPGHRVHWRARLRYPAGRCLGKEVPL